MRQDNPGTQHRARAGLRRLMAGIVAGSVIAGMAGAAFAADPAVIAAPTPPTSPIDADGTVNVPAFRLPPSIYLSPEARAALPRQPTDQEAPMRQALAAGRAGEMRARVGEFMAPAIKRYTELYPVTREATTIAGVPAIRVVPTGGVPKGNAGKVLLNLPGGGFVMGAAPGTGMLESIPVASLAKVQVISITYRQGPEFRYPAASDDVVAVYRELLKTHKPQDIGIFGCSAGGLLTAEAIARFLKDGLPLPAAIGMFCAAADARFDGDSNNYSRPFKAIGPKDSGPVYFQGTDLTDPLVSPVVDDATLRRFPPSLLISATRAMELSAVVNTHRALVRNGVEADLHVWDGLDHAFFYNATLPESREAFDVMRRFFKRHLKLAE